MGLKVINLGDEKASVSDGEHHHLKRQKSPGTDIFTVEILRRGKLISEVSDSLYTQMILIIIQEFI